jgi:hypothetical protein
VSPCLCLVTPGGFPLPFSYHSFCGGQDTPQASSSVLIWSRGCWGWPGGVCSSLFKEGFGIVWNRTCLLPYSFVVNLALQNLNVLEKLTGNYPSISVTYSSTEIFSKKETFRCSSHSLIWKRLVYLERRKKRKA